MVGTDCAADDADPSELEPLGIIDVPAGFELQPHEAGDTGPSDLAKAIRDDGLPDAEGALVEARFRRGYQWLWVNDDSNELIVFLYEFCDGAGARQYLSRGSEEELPAGVEPVVLDDLPEVDGYAGTRRGYSVTILYTVTGPYGVQVVAGGEPGTVDVDELTTRATTVLRSQLDRL